jgi:propionyl-CoA carboxylase alpha chain
MKMQNILRAEKAGVVKSIKKAVGAPLKVDEIVVEFE